LRSRQKTTRANPQPVIAAMRPKSGYHRQKLNIVRRSVTGSATGHSEDPWKLRAWTLQEELLSTRLIAFTRDEPQWSCKTETSCGTRAGRCGNKGVVVPAFHSLLWLLFAVLPECWQQSGLGKARGRYHLPCLDSGARRCYLSEKKDGLWMDLKSREVSSYVCLLCDSYCVTI
jgi:hypothetical protein